jgi:putative flippase GtrA
MRRLILALVSILPPALRRHATESRVETAIQFSTFGIVGMIGFVFDTATVYGLRGPLGLYGAGIVAYLVAATVTWGLNRLWTFSASARTPLLRQWLAFLSANFLGFLLNRGTYAVLVTVSALCARQPVIAIAAGVLAGMVTNFRLSRSLVFR